MPSTPGKSNHGEWFFDAAPVSWVRDGSLRNRPVFLFAHGAGAPLSSGFMQDTAIALSQRGVSVVRFNFPYMERAVREGRRRPPEAGPKLVRVCRSVFEQVVAMLPAARRHTPPIVVGGKSMGGRMMSLLLADANTVPAAGAVYLGYPLHPPGKPQALRAAHLGHIPVPQLFVSGTRDALAGVDLLRDTIDSLKRSTLHLVEGGDHSLAVRRRDATVGTDDWLDVVARFILEQTAPRL